MPIKTIFLDRDGIINKEVNYLHKIDDFEFMDGIFDCCAHFNNLGYKIIIITNQSGIARGYYQEADYMRLTSWMLDKFKEKNINILDIFHCPHGPDSSCICRKPEPGMFLDAKSKYNIEMEKSWMIGDKLIDIIAANSAGVNNTVLLKNNHSESKTESISSFYIYTLKELKKIIIK